MALSQYSYVDHLQVIKGFCDKADGKDKLTALVQYLCMFLSANEPGNIKKVQASVTAARKIFRIMRPLESLTPVLVSPGFNSKEPHVVQAINKLKNVLMAVYFGADHFVWAHQIGLITDKKAGERFQKTSLYAWALGSICTIVAETMQIVNLAVVRREGESDEEFNKRVEEVRKQTNQRLLLVIHAVVQALLACGLLQTLPFKPRTTGMLGVIASAMNCYFLMPSYPKPAPAPANAKKNM